MIQNARIMIESALGARIYTAQHIFPLLTLQMKRQFRPESISAYAAAQIFRPCANNTRITPTRKRRSTRPIPPIGPATGKRTSSMNFATTRKKGLIVERDTPTGRMLNLARPLSIRDEGCLVCHGRIEDAPKP